MVGRPLKFSSVEELQEKIDEYFRDMDHQKRPYTIGGLAVYLDCDRKTINNYEDREEFFPTIKRAKTKIESNIEEGALTGKYNPTSSIFNLKNNFGWTDKHEIESTNDTTMNINFNIPRPKKD